MIAIIHLFIIVISFYKIVNLCKLKILYHEELLIVCNEKTQQNNPLNRKRGITMGLGNRGMAFEMLIKLANEMYQRGGVALINKRPTPVKVLKSKGGRVLNGFYEAKVSLLLINLLVYCRPSSSSYHSKIKLKFIYLNPIPKKHFDCKSNVRSSNYKLLPSISNTSLVQFS